MAPKVYDGPGPDNNPDPAPTGVGPVPAESGTVGPQTGESQQPSGLPAPSTAENSTSRQSRYTLGIHTNAYFYDAPDYGHAWISVLDKKTGETTTYGLWPGTSLFADGESDTDVCKNFEQALNYKPTSSASFDLTTQQFTQLTEFIETQDTWTPWNTCANWASDAVQAATGVDIDAHDWLGIGTPRELTKSIMDYNFDQWLPLAKK